MKIKGRERSGKIRTLRPDCLRLRQLRSLHGASSYWIALCLMAVGTASVMGSSCFAREEEDDAELEAVTYSYLGAWC